MAALRAAETANSPYYRMSSALPALAYAAEPVVAVSTRDLAALIAVAEEAPAAIKQLRGVLPHSWVASLQVDADAGLAMLPAAKLRLQGISAPDDDERMAAAEQAASIVRSLPAHRPADMALDQFVRGHMAAATLWASIFHVLSTQLATGAAQTAGAAGTAGAARSTGMAAQSSPANEPLSVTAACHLAALLPTLASAIRVIACDPGLDASSSDALEDL